MSAWMLLEVAEINDRYTLPAGNVADSSKGAAH